MEYVENGQHTLTSTRDPPEHLNKKNTLLRHFKKYMSQNLLMVCVSTCMCLSVCPDVSVKYIRQNLLMVCVPVCACLSVCLDVSRTPL